MNFENVTTFDSALRELLKMPESDAFPCIVNVYEGEALVGQWNIRSADGEYRLQIEHVLLEAKMLIPQHLSHDISNIRFVTKSSGFPSVLTITFGIR